MMGLLLVMAVLVAIPLGIVVLVVVATPARIGANQSRQAGSRRGTALIFGLAALICHGVIAMGKHGRYIDLSYMLLFSLPAVGMVAALAAVMHRVLAGGSRIRAAFIGSAIAMSTALLMVSVMLATALLPSSAREVAYVAAFAAIMVLKLPSIGISLALLGAGAGLLVRGMARRKPHLSRTATADFLVNDASDSSVRKY